MSYTSDTLRELRQRYPDDELWLLMGTDMFLSLHRWHEFGDWPLLFLFAASLAGLFMVKYRHEN